MNLPDDDIMRLLHSLSCAKYRILNKVPVSKTISKTDNFSFNNRFTDKMRRIKVRGCRCEVTVQGSSSGTELYERCGLRLCGLMW